MKKKEQYSKSKKTVADFSSKQTCYKDSADTNEKIKEELAYKTRQLAELQEIAHIGSWEYNFFTEVTTWSDELFRICGFKPDNFSPSFDNFVKCLHPEDREKVSILNEIADEEQQAINSVLRIIRPDGSMRIVKCKTNISTDAKGNMLRISGTCHDITEMSTNIFLPKIHYDIYVKVEGKFIKIYTKEIFYIEAMGDYITILTAAKKYIVNSTMRNIEAKLPSSVFMRVHHSFIVNSDKISSIEKTALIIDNKTIPVSRSYWKEFIKHIKLV